MPSSYGRQMKIPAGMFGTNSCLGLGRSRLVAPNWRVTSKSEVEPRADPDGPDLGFGEVWFFLMRLAIISAKPFLANVRIAEIL